MQQPDIASPELPEAAASSPASAPAPDTVIAK